MPRQALEPGAYPPKYKLQPEKGADGTWRLTDVRHRAHSGIYVRTSGSGRTRAECLADWDRNFQVNVLKGTVRKRVSKRRQFKPSDKMSDVFAHWYELQEAREEKGEISGATLDSWRRDLYPSDYRTARKDSPKLDVEMGALSVREAADPAMLADYFDDISEDKPALACNHYRTLSLIFKMLVQTPALEAHPLQWVDMPERSQGKQRALTRSEWPLLRKYIQTWQEADRHRNQFLTTYADVLLGTGCRPGEGLAIRWCDVPDLDTEPNPVLCICGTAVRRRGVGVIRQGHRKKHAPDYYVVLPTWCADSLREHKRDADPADPESLIFLSQLGKKIVDPQSVNESLDLLREGTPFDWMKWSHYRDTVATHLTNLTGDDKAASAQLGHAEGSSMAKRHYIDRRGITRAAVDNSGHLEELNPKMTGK